MANNDLKTIKELLEVVNNKVGKLENHVFLHSGTLHSMKDQQSVMNEKLDNLQAGMDELNELPRSRAARYPVGKVLSPVHPRSKLRGILRQNKKADQIFKYASEADEDLQDTKKKVARIERVSVIAHALK